MKVNHDAESPGVSAQCSILVLVPQMLVVAHRTVVFERLSPQRSWKDRVLPTDLPDRDHPPILCVDNSGNGQRLGASHGLEPDENLANPAKRLDDSLKRAP